MPFIEGFWIRNYKNLRQIAFGSSFRYTTVFQNDTDFGPYELRPLTIITGPNGTGKSAILDVFGLLGDVIQEGIDAAFQKRGGFSSVCTREEEEAITIGMAFRACADPRPINYVVTFEEKKGRSPIISNEALLYRSDENNPDNTTLLFFQNGIKTTRHVAPWAGMRMEDLNKVKSTDAKHLGLSQLGLYEDYPDVFQLRQFLCNGFALSMSLDLAAALSVPTVPRNTNELRINKLLDLMRLMEEKHRYNLPEILHQLAQRLPGIKDVLLSKTESGRLVLRFLTERYGEPFLAHEVSNGLLRLFAHLMLLEDSIPQSLLRIDEIDASLDIEMNRVLIDSLYHHVENIGSTQFFITADSPYFLDQMAPSDVWILENDPDGYATSYRASDDLLDRGFTEIPQDMRWFTDIVGRK